jgi:hypothetical protein
MTWPSVLEKKYGKLIALNTKVRFQIRGSGELHSGRIVGYEDGVCLHKPRKEVAYTVARDSNDDWFHPVWLDEMEIIE